MTQTSVQHDAFKQKYPQPFHLGMSVVFITGGILALLLFFPGASVLSRLQWLDSGICAQILSHSFYPGGNRLPLCARNTGIYLGFFVTLVTLYIRGRGRAYYLPRWSIVTALAGGIAAMAIDGFNSLLLDLHQPHLYQPDNILRLATGLVTGLALALFFLPMLNRLFWRGYNEQRSVTSWKELVTFLPALIGSFFIVLSQEVWTLYPVALLSTSGVLTVLSGLNMLVLVAVSKRDETFESYKELLPFFALALLCAIGEMLLLAQGRLALVHLLSV